MAPQIERFDIPTSGPIDHLSNFHQTAAQRLPPNYDVVNPISYGADMDMTKCLQPRMFGAYPERTNWDFLGLES